MSHVKKKFQFQKILEDYEFMKQKLDSKEVEENVDETVLLANSESLNYEGCEKIFFRLRHILTLKTIIVKSNGNNSVANLITRSNEAQIYEDGPVFFTKYVLNTLYQAITDYLYNSDRIKILAFKKTPITSDLPIICQGIRNNKSIRVLHFEDCEICDDGCIQICQALRKSPVESLGLQNCKITSTGASWLAWLIGEQSMLRTLTSWNKYKNDYEYKTEQGVRKLIINDNPGIQDSGAKFIINTLFDNDWLTHIHMRNSGLTDITGLLILRLLAQNKSLTLFDTSRNYFSSNQIVKQICEGLSNLTKTSVPDVRSKSAGVKRFKKSNLKRRKTTSSIVNFDGSQQISNVNLLSEQFEMVGNSPEENVYEGSLKPNPKKNVEIHRKSQVLKHLEGNKQKAKSAVYPKSYDMIFQMNADDTIPKYDKGSKKDLELKRQADFQILTL